MPMRKYLIFFCLICLHLASHAQSNPTLLHRSLYGYTDYSWKTGQKDTISWGFNVFAVASSGKYAPYWLFTNYDGCPFTPYNGSTSIVIQKAYTNPHRWMDYSFKLNPMLTIDKNGFSPCFQELYFSARLLVFEITVGMKPDNYGYYEADKDITSGGLLFSHNASLIPRISIGTTDYIPIPFTFGYAEIKGGLTHGWFGNDGYVKKAFLHHKYAGLKLGGRLPVNIGYEFHHAAQWGGVSPVYGELGSSFHDFLNTFFVRSGGVMANDQINAQGNHIGSQILTADFKWKDWNVSAYWQTLSEDGPIRFLWNAMNAYDGLWGIKISNTSFPYLSTILYEFLNTTQQSGAFHDRDGIVYGGGDHYFTNGIYKNGWTYGGFTIGHPLITSPVLLPGEQISPIYNRVRAHHIGVKGDIFGYNYKAMTTISNYYDDYQIPIGLQNCAILINVKKHFKKAWNMEFGLSLAADIGTQFGNSFGAMVSIAKRGIIWGQK